MSTLINVIISSVSHVSIMCKKGICNNQACGLLVQLLIDIIIIISDVIFVNSREKYQMSMNSLRVSSQKVVMIEEYVIREVLWLVLF